MWKPVFTRACESHGRSVKYNGGRDVGFAGISAGPAPSRTAPQHPESAVLLNQLWKAENIPLIQPIEFKDQSFKMETYSELKKPENVEFFFQATLHVENEPWDSGC